MRISLLNNIPADLEYAEGTRPCVWKTVITMINAAPRVSLLPWILLRHRTSVIA